MQIQLTAKPIRILEVAEQAVHSRMAQYELAKATNQSPFIRGMCAQEVSHEYNRYRQYRLNVIRAGRN